MTQLKVFKRESVFIPIKSIPVQTRDRIKEKLSFKFYEKDGKACKECDNYAERHNDLCDNCGVYNGGFDLGSVVTVKSNKYLKIPVGSSPEIFRYLEENQGFDVSIVDKSPKTTIEPIKFVGTLKPEQEIAVQGLIKNKRGILKAPPRSGKCVDGSTMISTNRGLVHIDSLFEGLQLSKTGETILDAPPGTRVHTSEGFRDVARLYSKTVDQVVTITTELGKKLRGTPNHPVRVATEGGLEWKALEELNVGDFVVSNHANGWGGCGDRLLGSMQDVEARIKPKSNGLIRGRVPTRMTKDLAAVLGFLTADGRCRHHPGLSFCNTSEEKLRLFKKSWDACFPDHPIKRSVDEERAPSLHTSCAYVRFFLEERCGWPLRNAGQEEIPAVLLVRDQEFMLSYLGAYMSCDGELNATLAVFSSASFKFARQLSAVLTTLGIRNRSARDPVDIELDHVTKGKRTGKYGVCRIKRSEFDILHRMLGDRLFRPDLVGRDPRAVDQSDNIPFLRANLIGLEHSRQFRVGQKYFMKDDRGQKVANTKFIRDRRGPGRKPHMNRASLGEDSGSSIPKTVFLDDGLRKISPKAWRLAKQVTDSRITFEQIVSVEVAKTPTRVYDLEVPANTQFYGNGILCHNTVTATALACRLQKKTLFIASQRDWLMGFQETFIGSKTQAPLTDLDPKRIKLCKTLADFESHDICLATVQTFYSENGQKLLAKIRDMFEVIIGDEIHTGAADKYIRILSKLNARYMLGLSATPSRKDLKMVLVDNVVGPIIHEVIVEGMRPHLRLTRTKYSKDYKGQVPWTRMVSSLENDVGRLKLIAEWVLKDVAAGHMVMIPMATVKPIHKLIKLINDKAGKIIAYPFVGGLRKEVRDDTIQKAREYKIKVLIGTSKIMSTGINIPRASCLYEQALSSNKENATQRMRRVLTPMEGKPEPVIRYFLDDFNVRRNCIRTEYFQVMLPDMKPIMDDKTRDAMKKYLNEKSGAGNARFFDL